ncbi:hypothetical protein TWF730_009904 [Orbilia blumenaviensis]|uniref:Peptidase C14 caspase domain-containing protein n=1 Tax=Orbilia blumenaviensis TaxID=1796055 RepID=A0AAV9UZR5_9PEZI
MAQIENNWAILIGINDYGPLGIPEIRNLRGCVKDVDDQEKWLASRIVPQENIIRFTTKVGDRQPTYTNIWKALEDVRDNAKPGAVIVIHFSGHGSRVPTLLPELEVKKGERKDEILLFQEGYLRDFEFGAILDEIAKDRILFVVLDCCHSGGADRDENKGRRRGVDINITEKLSGHDIKPELLEKSKGALGAWWERTRDYTVLAACQSNQEARETSSPDINGVLTYWMMKGLEELHDQEKPSSYQILHRSIYRNIFQDSHGQYPVILGLSNRTLFSKILLPLTELAFVEKVRRDQGYIELNVGEAHSVSKGARYAIYARSSNPVSESEEKVVEITIDRVGGLSSRAYLPPCVDLSRISIGCIAELLSPGDEDIVNVQLEVDEGSGPGECLKLWQETLERCCHLPARIRLKTTKSDQEPSFRLRLSNGYYHILSADLNSGPIQYVQPISVDDPQGAEKACRVLLRQENFRRIERLRNSSSNIDNMFSFGFTRADSRGESEDVKAGNTITFQISNTSTSSDIYYCIFNLRPLGGIKQLIPKPGESLNHVRAGKSSGNIRIKVSVPEELTRQGIKRVKSIFKVIVTTQPTFFDTYQSEDFLSSECYQNRRHTNDRNSRFVRVVDQLERGNWQTKQVDIYVKQMD